MDSAGMVLVEKQGVSMDFTDRLEALLQKATPGPWREATDAQGTCGLLHPDRHGVAVAWFSDVHKPVDGYVGEGIGRPDRQANVDLIRLMIDHAPALLAVVKAAQQCVDPNDTWPQEGRQIKLRQALTRLSERRGE
jgi:hypothetical protein